MRVKCWTRFSVQADFEQDNGRSSDLGQRRSVTLLVEAVHKENGTESQKRLSPDVAVGEVDELEEDVEQCLSCLEGVIEVEGWEPEENLVDKPGTTIGRKYSLLHCIRIPLLMRCVFWPLIHSKEYPFSSQSFPSANTAGVFSRTFVVKNFSNSSTYCCLFMRLHFSIGGYDYPRTTRFRQGIHISASLTSFLLIMCIDAPESTTNSSSGFNADAGRHLISEGEKNVALSWSLNF